MEFHSGIQGFFVELFLRLSSLCMLSHRLVCELLSLALVEDHGPLFDYFSELALLDVLFEQLDCRGLHLFLMEFSGYSLAVLLLLSLQTRDLPLEEVFYKHPEVDFALNLSSLSC